MSLEVLIPMLITGAGTGLTCGISCGACGNPIVNMFLASYLFTHTGQWKQSLRAFLSFHLGKACSVMLLCGLLSMLETVVTDENGNLFGIPMQKIVYFAMLMFAVYLIVKWFLENQTKKGCSGICKNAKREPQRQKHMFLYGWISGMSPCASLVLVLGYASALTAAEAPARPHIILTTGDEIDPATAPVTTKFDEKTAGAFITEIFGGLDEAPDLNELLSRFTCSACAKRCLLASPSCFVGNGKQKTAIAIYQEMYPEAEV